MKQVIIAVGLLLISFTLPMGTRADASPDQIQALLTQEAPSIVTVKVVIRTQFKMEGQAQDSESRSELQGAVVSSDGLIMLTNAPFDTKNLTSMFGMPDTSDFEMKTTPTDFKVVIGNEDKEYSAFLAATDANLGLCFIKIEDLAGRALQPIDFTAPATPSIGDKVYVVSRLSRGYDYASYLDAGSISGQIAKPQAAWIVSDVGDMGLPVFDSSGGLIGVMANVPSGVTDTQGSGDAMGLGMLMRIVGGGGGASHMSVFLVPASTIANSITLAKQQAITVAASRAKDNASAPPSSAGSSTAPEKSNPAPTPSE